MNYRSDFTKPNFLETVNKCHTHFYLINKTFSSTVLVCLLNIRNKKI